MDYWSGKGVGSFQVPVDGHLLTLCNTHMHARYARAGVEDDYIGHRSAEVIELADELRKKTGPVVAAGDFNMQDAAPEYRLLTEMSGLVDVAAAVDARQPTSTLSNAWRKARGAISESRIDYVYARSGEKVGVTPVSARRVFDETVEVAGRQGAYSDHAGVLAELEVGGPGRPAQPIPSSTFALARELLDNGRDRARRRRRNEQLGSAAAAAGAVGALTTSRRLGRTQLRRLTRRGFLRAGLLATGGLAALSSAGLLVTSGHFIPHELEDFDRIESLLAEIERQEMKEGTRPVASTTSLR
jgi:hypothetical protein